MQRSATIADILSLLDELEGKVHQDSRLEAEWEAALSEQPTAAVRSDEAARFREWFLLERDSEHLGAPPVQAFAPQEIEDDSSWARLLDNFLGIFRLEGTRRVEGREVLDVADLWSGRTAHLPLDILSGASIDSEDLLLVGRLVLADDEIHLPLPGLRLAHAPGLARAVEADLALARHHQPRARLSQKECDALFQQLPAAVEAPQPSTESPAHLLEELDQLLAATPGWDADRIQESLNQYGLAATLDRLAFETLADLEELRRILPALAELGTQAGPVAAQQPSSDDHLDQSAAQAALEAYDQARAEGTQLADAFRELEAALGLEPGVSEEILPNVERDGPSVGPEAAAGLAAWLEAFQWEHPGAPIGPSLHKLATQAQLQAGKSLDAQDLQAEHVLPFLMASQDLTQFEKRRAEVLDFLRWAAIEQGAPLEAALTDWAQASDRRLPAIVAANAGWREQGADWRNRQAVAELNPPRVRAEGDELAAITGLPDGLAEHLRRGDLILGCWHAGHFEAAAIVPREAVAVPPTDTDESDDLDPA